MFGHQWAVLWMPIFECVKCHRKVRAEYGVSYTGDERRNVEKSGWCCGKPMNELLWSVYLHLGTRHFWVCQDTGKFG